MGDHKNRVVESFLTINAHRIKNNNVKVLYILKKIIVEKT